MSRQDSAFRQTYQVNEPSILGADSGFESGCDNMRNCNGMADEQLSQCLVHMKYSHMNDLEAARTHQQRLQPHQQNIRGSVSAQNTDQHNVKWDQASKLPNSEIMKLGYEFFYKQDDDGDTYLHMSIAMKNVEASLWLISQAPHSCLLDLANDDKETALHVAVMASEPAVVRRLVLCGSNPRLRTRSGDTALHIACARGDLACAKALTEPLTPAECTWLAGRPAGSPVLAPNFEIQNFVGKTCLHVAASEGHAELVDQLVRFGANVEARDGLAGRTALHLAVENDCREVVRFLLRERPTCIDSTTYARYTAYQIAVELKRQELAEELLSLGASPELRDSDSSCSSSCSSSSSSGSDDECEIVEHFARLPIDAAATAAGVRQMSAQRSGIV